MKIPPRINPDVDNSHSSSRKNSEGDEATRPDTTPINSARTSTTHPAVDGIITIRMSRSMPTIKDLRLPKKDFRTGMATPAPEPTLRDNLLQLLSIGSRDSLNVLLSMFEFHQYDKTVLEKYVKDKSPDNLKALQRHINSQAESSANLNSGARSQP
jgi:hypothetical protein